jgi:preprotein translocase SecF subunit
MRIETAADVGIPAIRAALESGGVPSAEIQTFGSERELLIRARLDALPSGRAASVEEIAAATRAALDAGIGADAYEIDRVEAVSGKVGAELQRGALIAILFSFVTTLLYLAIRFEWRFGLAAVLATAHDLLATLAFIRYLDLEVGLVVVAAVLTVLGYSLNDTIVIFDRIRENLRGASRSDLAAILNRSINETLRRTLLTGGTTLATALVLGFFAGEVIRPFGLIMAFGIGVGTLSSIFIAAPVLQWIVRRWTADAPAAVVSEPAAASARGRV